MLALLLFIMATLDPNGSSEPLFLTIPQAAERLGQLSAETLYRLSREGHLPTPRHRSTGGHLGSKARGMGQRDRQRSLGHVSGRFVMSIPTPVRPISQSLRQVLAESFSAAELRHIAAAFAAREHVPDVLALVLAEELAEIHSRPPMESDYGPIYNRPTILWFRRRSQRTAEARAS